MNHQNYFWIDNLRAFGILLVVVGHAGAPGMIGKFIYGFHMPLFFIISGYLFNDEKWISNGLKSFFINRWKSYIKLYFLWAAVNLLLNIPIEFYVKGFSLNDIIDSTLNHIKWILVSYGGYQDYPNCTPLWYLPCLFVSSLYLFVIVWIQNRKGVAIALVITMLMLITNYLIINRIEVIFPWHVDVALCGATFMYLGYLIKKTNFLIKKKHLTQIVTLLIIGIAAIMTNGKIDMNMNMIGIQPLFFIGAIAVTFVIMYKFVTVDVLSQKYSILSRIGGGKNTITILALNYFLNTVFNLTLGNCLPSMVKWIVDVVFVMCACYIIILFLEKNKKTQPK